MTARTHCWSPGTCAHCLAQKVASLTAVNARLLAACRSAHAGADHADDCWHWTAQYVCNCYLAKLRAAIAEAEEDRP